MRNKFVYLGLCLYFYFFIDPPVSLGYTYSGYKLWLKYEKIDSRSLASYGSMLQSVCVMGDSPTIEAARRELEVGLSGLLGRQISFSSIPEVTTKVVISSIDNLPESWRTLLEKDLFRLRKEGFLIRYIGNGKGASLCIIGRDDIGVLYGVFHLLRTVQTRGDLTKIDQMHAPRLQWRMLNHWDNLDGTVERGYAGLSIWKWNEMSDKAEKRYIDYARANASIGINGVVVNNVNASHKILSVEYIEKVKVLADIFRPYGIRVFVSINFASPKVLSKLQTADPLDDTVKKWWSEKIGDIYTRIPDFGGFLVKANSEGQPGPQDYGRTHAEGANMLAEALASHQGILIWRAFVYEAHNQDRVKDAYEEFIRFDGKFLPNVMLQTKNGPLDFQPREPFSPLFGAMPGTSQMIEFQITQEYLGFGTHLVYLPSLYKQVLDSDTYAAGAGSTVGRVIDGSLQGQLLTGMAGVANIGDAENWTGHPFGQANWYAYGRLAWDHYLDIGQLAEEWIRMTLTSDTAAIPVIKNMMLRSYDHLVNYQTPLGLTVLSSLGHHYGPQPWTRKSFHKADYIGIGFDRSANGSRAVEQYFPGVRHVFNDLDSCPEKYKTWFHHVPWDYVMESGRSFWEELCFSYHKGVDGVRSMQRDWESVQKAIHPSLHNHVSELLAVQEDEAVWWRDACLWYFNKFSRKPVPPHYERPRYSEDDFKRKELESKKLKHYSTGSPE